MVQSGGSSEWAELAGKPSGLKVSGTLLVRSLFWSCGDRAAQVIGSLTEAGTLHTVVAAWCLPQSPLIGAIWRKQEQNKNENQERFEDVGALPGVCFVFVLDGGGLALRHASGPLSGQDETGAVAQVFGINQSTERCPWGIGHMGCHLEGSQL